MLYYEVIKGGEMVVGHHKVIHECGQGNERCVTLEQALIEGQRFDGVTGGLVLIHAMRDQGLKYDEVNVRVADQSVTVQNSGCIPEHESVTYETRLVVTDCPSECALRCAKCILNLPDGQKLIDSLKPFDLHVRRS